VLKKSDSQFLEAYTQIMKRIVFLTCDNLDGYVTDDELTLAPLKKAGWSVDVISWTSDCDWSVYRAALVRTTWDYTQHLDQFLEKMKLISSRTQLINSFDIIIWNSRKNYLKDLTTWGLKTIPTTFEWPQDWNQLFRQWQTGTLMVKPQVGANSVGTYMITPSNIPSSPLFNEAPLIQPFREKIFTEGELSFHFFGGKYSHTVRKIPKRGDYRVQEEHGGTILSENPSADDLEQAIKIYQTVEMNLKQPTLFHRVDVVKNSKNQMEIMEVELVEPSLYFRTNKDAPQNFIKALELFLR
jgi:hypothetical protein